MSLGVVIKGAEGVVLAADSRVTLEARNPSGTGVFVNFDNATKLLSFSELNNYVGAVTYGAAIIGQRTAHSYIPEFEVWLQEKRRLPIQEFSQQLSRFFMDRWHELMPPDYQGAGMTFIVGGYDEGDAYGKVFLFEIPHHPDPQPRNPGEHEFGMTWGGQLEIASRLIHGYDPGLLTLLQQRFGLDDQQTGELRTAFRQSLEFTIPYNVLPLQDCVDLAAFLVRTTMTAQRLAVGIRGVGGPIEVAVITRTRGLEFVQQKKLRGERREG